MKVTFSKSIEMYIFHVPACNILRKKYNFMSLQFYILTEDSMILEYWYSILTKEVARVKAIGLWPFRDAPTKFMCM